MVDESCLVRVKRTTERLHKPFDIVFHGLIGKYNSLKVLHKKLNVKPTLFFIYKTFAVALPWIHKFKQQVLLLLRANFPAFNFRYIYLYLFDWILIIITADYKHFSMCLISADSLKANNARGYYF